MRRCSWRTSCTAPASAPRCARWWSKAARGSATSAAASWPRACAPRTIAKAPSRTSRPSPARPATRSCAATPDSRRCSTSTPAASTAAPSTWPRTCSSSRPRRSTSADSPPTSTSSASSFPGAARGSRRACRRWRGSPSSWACRAAAPRSSSRCSTVIRRWQESARARASSPWATRWCTRAPGRAAWEPLRPQTPPCSRRTTSPSHAPPRCRASDGSWTSRSTPGDGSPPWPPSCRAHAACTSRATRATPRSASTSPTSTCATSRGPVPSRESAP